MAIVSILVFVLVFGVLIMIHEWGHFTAARKNGITVEEFGFGLPPRIWGKKKDGVIYSINAIPFGGFVRMLGENDSESDAKGSFGQCSLLGRTVVVLAGVFMNFILAWVILTGLFIVGTKPMAVVSDDMIGYNSYVVMKQSHAMEWADVGMREDVAERPGIVVTQLMPGGAAEKAGIAAGDVIHRLNGKEVTEMESIAEMLALYPSQELPAQIWQGSDLVEITLSVPEEAKIGVILASNEYPDFSDKPIQFPFYKAPFVALQEIGGMSVATFDMFIDLLAGIFTRFEVSENVSGPVGIYSMTDALVKAGSVHAILQMTAMLSVSLMVINVFPFPALDGGRAVFLLYELIARRRPNQTVEMVVNGFGFLFLIGLLFFVTFKDVIRLVLN